MSSTVCRRKTSKILPGKKELGKVKTEVVLQATGRTLQVLSVATGRQIQNETAKVTGKF